ncbi:hypothetical protein [uncultured Gimesia sp.]|uniref:TadE/TadG family type IV pilus assembly protein n=1 Tax=uncultured Gimesia sp. TaxID=1678688 RepID=UPI002632C909|nr:hypothetical protein [uncultured Gimesia sp.]
MKQIYSKTESHKNRRGIAILWLILWGSVFLTFFCGVLEIATLWQAQVEVKNALDAGAMAAVKEWGVSGSGSSTQVSRNVGIAYVEANPILGTPVTLTSNYIAATPGNPNGNLLCTGNFVFGALDQITAPITFDRNAQGGCIAGFPAVVAQATVPVQGFCSSLFGVTFFNISSQSTAYYNCGTGRASLVSATVPVCP